MVQARKYEHDQIWADPLSIDPVQWERMARGRPRKWAGWVRSAKKADDKGTPWCPKLSAGSINYSIRYDYPYFEKHPEEALPESLTFLAPHRSTSVSEDSLAKAKPAPSLKKRRSIERQAKEEGRALKRARLDSELEPGEIKPYNPGPLDRREAVYGKRKKGQIQRNWRKYAVDLVQKLTEEGIQCIVGKEWVQSFKNMGSPS